MILTMSYHAICLTETWCTDLDDDLYPLYDSYGYRLVETHRIGKKGGGTSIAYKIAFPPATILFAESNSVIIGFSHLKLLLACIYFSPATSASDKSAVIKQLRGLLNKFWNYHVILCGDFNFYNISWPDLCPLYQFLFDFLHEFLDEIYLSFNLHQIINFPTRAHNYLDLLFTSIDDSFAEASFGFWADHVPIIFTSRSLLGPHEIPNLITHRDWNYCNWDEVILEMESFPWYKLYQTNIQFR